MGDVDGDMTPDFAVGAPEARLETGARAGQVTVFSGSNGRRLRTMAGTQDGELFGSSLAKIPDVDNDGAPDIVVGSPEFKGPSGGLMGRLAAVSSRSGRTLWEVTADAPGTGFGSHVVASGLDDAGACIAVSLPWIEYDGGTKMGMVEIRSPMDGRRTCTILNRPPEAAAIEWFGGAMCFVASIRENDPPDLMIAVAGSIRRHSIRSGACIQETLPGPSEGNHVRHVLDMCAFGESSAAMPSHVAAIDADLEKQCVVSVQDPGGRRVTLGPPRMLDAQDPWCVIDWNATTHEFVLLTRFNRARDFHGSVELIEQASGRIRLRVLPEPGGAFGDTCSVVGDMDGDGYDDIAVDGGVIQPVGAAVAQGGRVRIVSAADGRTIGIVAGRQE